MRVEIAVLAKAPVPGYAKTRLVPRLGADGAARLQARLIDRALATAVAADAGPVTLWGAPDDGHPALRALARRHGAAARAQPAGDLGARMHAASAGGATLVIGTDCPALTPALLRAAAATLARGDDAVLIPAEDGGYVLIGLATPQPAVFTNVDWGTAGVLAQTRERLAQAGLRWTELDTLWDVDRPADLDRPLARALLAPADGPDAGGAPQ
jgi:hypothetical protein